MNHEQRHVTGPQQQGTPHPDEKPLSGGAPLETWGHPESYRDPVPCQGRLGQLLRTHLPWLDLAPKTMHLEGSLPAGLNPASLLQP